MNYFLYQKDTREHKSLNASCKIKTFLKLIFLNIVCQSMQQNPGYIGLFHIKIKPKIGLSV